MEGLQGDVLAEIAIYAMPERLFRYRGITEANFDRELKAIEEHYLYCPPISKMNDPMEGEHSESRMFRVISKRGNHRQHVQDYIARCGIASLSESSLNEPMWAHYANNFEGICIEYHLGRLAAALPDEVAIVRMQYSEQEPTLRANKESTEDRARLVLSSKTLRWATEREWRVLCRTIGPLYYESEKPVVMSVYVGSRMPDDMMEELVRRMERADIGVQLMKIDRYTIQFSAKVESTTGGETVRDRRRTRNVTLQDIRGGTVTR